MINFAIVDDHPLVRKALVDTLRASGKYNCVFEASDGNEFLQLYPEKMCDLVLIDIMMPKKNGIETLQWLKQFDPVVKTVLMSFYSDQPSIDTLLALGTDGYISKSWDFSIIWPILDEIIEKPVSNKIQYGKTKEQKQNELVITEREKTLLELSSSELTYEEIARDLHISIKTVDKHRASLFKKFNVRSRTRLVMQAIKLGMINWWE